jgi:hypothetical protein
MSGPAFGVTFDDAALAEDLEHSSAPGRVVGLDARRQFAAHGIEVALLRPCRDGTRLPGCVKTYLPAPPGLGHGLRGAAQRARSAIHALRRVRQTPPPTRRPAQRRPARRPSAREGLNRPANREMAADDTILPNTPVARRRDRASREAGQRAGGGDRRPRPSRVHQIKKPTRAMGPSTADATRSVHVDVR